jgi:hypothetical protein
MATTGDTVSAVKERRSLEAYLHMPRGGDYKLTLYRQVVLKSGDDVLGAARDDKPITRTASQIAAQSVTVGGKTYTGAEVMAALAAFFDAFDEQDNPPAPAEPPPAPPEGGA